MRLKHCAALVALTLAGCGASAPEIVPIETAPVTGVAMYDGKPLEDYRVYFYRSDHPAQEPATARIDAEGKFTLSVRESDDGAIIGLNQVWFSYDPPIPPTDEPYDLPEPKVKLPEQYLKRETSNLTVDVPKEGLDGYTIELPQ